MQKHKILILGGGFAGIIAAQNLAKQNLKNTEIRLVSNKNYFEYYPALYRIVTGSSPIEVCVPLRDIIPNSVEIDIDTVLKIDLQNKKINGESGAHYSYDTLILALGSQTTDFGVSGVSDFSLGFKSIGEALRLKKHITELFENHEHPSVQEYVSHFHIVIVGGGASGVEVAGDLSFHMQNLAKTHNVDPSFVTIDLIESNPRLIPTLSPKVSAKILEKLRLLGVNVYLNRFLMKEELEQVYLKDMSMQAKTVIWTAGTQINKVVATTSEFVFAKNKRVNVDEYMQAENLKDVFVVGDLAATKYSGLAQTAIYDAKFISKNIERSLNGKSMKKYIPKPIAFSLPIGESYGVFVYGGVVIYGRIAYWMRHIIDFMFFSSILSCKKLFSLFFEGWKYRKEK